MAYVSVPNDLSKVKTKVAFNLTKRQLVCFGVAAVIGIPTYLFARSVIGGTAAMLLMIALMLPCFFFAMYERDGLPFEKVLGNIVRTKFLWPQTRPYKTQNIVDIGIFPKTENGPLRIVNFDAREDVEQGRFMAWGFLVYDAPLTEKQIDDFELRAALDNPGQLHLSSKQSEKQTQLAVRQKTKPSIAEGVKKSEADNAMRPAAKKIPDKDR